LVLGACVVDTAIVSLTSYLLSIICLWYHLVMHEVAHNCGTCRHRLDGWISVIIQVSLTASTSTSLSTGLGHAFENGEEYGDETTIMGFSSSSKIGPSKCFNGQNIWHFGWFKVRRYHHSQSSCVASVTL
jgi:hypothetical protein